MGKRYLMGELARFQAVSAGLLAAGAIEVRDIPNPYPRPVSLTPELPVDKDENRRAILAIGRTLAGL